MRAPTQEDVQKVAQYPARNHPNASIAATTGALATILIWIAGVLGIAMTAEHGAAAATLLATASLVLGRKGIRGVIRSLWRGDGEDD